MKKRTNTSDNTKGKTTMTNEQSRGMTKEERNFVQWCMKLDNKDKNAIHNDITLHSVASFKAINSDCINDRLRAAIAVMETEPESARKSLYMAALQDFARELCKEEDGFIEKDVLENVGARYDGNGEIDYNFELVYKEPRLISSGELNKDQNDHSPVTDRDCEQIGFMDYCIAVAENPKKHIDNIEALNAIADFENPNEDEMVFRLSAAIRLLRLQPKTPINEVIMAALKDRKSINGDLLVIQGLEYDY